MNEGSPHSYSVVEFFISDKKQENKINFCCFVTDVITAAPLTTPSSSTNKQMKKLGLLAAESCCGLTEVGILMDLMHVTSHPPSRDLPEAAIGQS
ncbi:hypothetical protein AVEN_230690-1 [Araneus ventricosus]|uniref:Uncharacterized protein n=1 Tax=Araneus ventricosus TaxID=182803 RepID=A0A4Y2A1R0_ARAVE|nr:hypothetical protein AVEN_230690-1 [Araneus ventricosus]